MVKKIFYSVLLFISFIASTGLAAQGLQTTTKKNLRDRVGSWQQLATTASNSGKPEWRPMLAYMVQLHKRNTHEATWPFYYEWEGLGPGYVYGEAFGHWDIV